MSGYLLSTFYSDLFEILQVFCSNSDDVHWALSTH